MFRENKFSAPSELPFGSLAMPAFSQIRPDIALITIEMNHFQCKCDRLAWFIAANVHNFDREALMAIGDDRKGFGSLDFIERLYTSSGNCLQCSVTKCEIDPSTSFIDFASSALEYRQGELKCRSSGQSVREQRPRPTDPQPPPTAPSSYEYEPGGSVDRLRRPTQRIPTISPPTRDEEGATREITDSDFTNGSDNKSSKGLLITLSLVMVISVAGVIS